MKVAIYCRVSTDNQEREGTSLKTQYEACRDYCLNKGYEIVKQFSETYSGLTLERPLLDELRDLIRSQEVDKVVIYCLDRFSRNPTHGVILLEELEKHSVKLEAVTEDIDNSELGKLISYIRGFASKFEAEKIKERTMRGKKEFLKRGLYPQGVGIGIYGYDWDKANHKRLIKENESKVVQRIFSMVIRGDSVNKIAIELNKASIPSKSGGLWYPLTVRRIIGNEAYTGKTYFGMSKRVSKSKVILKPREEWFSLPDVTPSIISESEFLQAQEARKRSKDACPVKVNSPYLLSGLVRCPLCGSPVSGTTLNGKYRYYKCRGSVPTATRGKICNAHYIQASELEEFVWQKFIKLLASPSTQIDALDEILGVEYDFDVISPIVAETESTELQAVEPQLESPKRSNLKLSIEEQIAKLKTKQKDCAKREQKCYEMLSSDDYDHDKTLDVINSWKQKQVEIEKEIIVLEETRKHTGVIKIIAPKISEISEKFKKNADSLGFIEKRQLLQVFRSHIVALPGDYKYTCLLNSYIGFGIPDSEFEYDEAKESQYAERIKDIEAKYPDLTVLDLTNKPNFEKSAYGQAIITFEKILVTIERTSASQHADSCPCRRV